MTVKEFYEEHIKDIPQEANDSTVREYKMFIAYIILKKKIKTSYVELGKLLGVNDTTILRLNNDRYKGKYAAIRKFVEEHKEFFDNPTFEYYMFHYRIKSLAPSTIDRSKFYNDYFKLGVKKGIYEASDAYQKKIEKPKTIFEKAKASAKRKAQKQVNREINEKVSKKPVKQKKVHISAHSTSSELTKRLANRYNEKIINIKENDYSFLEI